MQKKTDTLKEYIEDIHEVNVTNPKSELGQHIIKLMCENTADGILMQCMWSRIWFLPRYIIKSS